MRSGRAEGKREGVGSGVGARACSSSSGGSSRREVGSRVGVEEGDGDAFGTGVETGLGEAIGVEEGKCLPSHPVRASGKITAQTKVYIAFFIGRAKISSLGGGSYPRPMSPAGAKLQHTGGRCTQTWNYLL